MKVFNTTAVCIPSKHYMVDISDKVREIRKMVDDGKYFTINRARQYGKTTTLTALARVLSNDYYVVSMDFQAFGNESFADADVFCRDFANDFCSHLQKFPMDEGLSDVVCDMMRIAEDESRQLRLYTMFKSMEKIWEKAQKPIVLIIDEVDSATNNQIFLDFLAQLRLNYIKRETDSGYKTFQSVVLAGVTDIKHLKSKIRDDSEHKVNSPWNIAADFTVDMSLSEEGIRGMLDEYESDHHVKMDTAEMARRLHEYTSGYPFLVSRLCQLMDTTVTGNTGASDAWTKQGFEQALRLILSEGNTLFQSLIKNLNNSPRLKDSIRSLLMDGEKIAYNGQQDDVALLEMYGLIRNDHGMVRIANRIFETMLYNLFLTEDEMKRSVFAREGDFAKNQFVRDGKLDMRLILERFAKTYTEVFGPLEEKFKERDGREQFLLYLRPIINGTGNYYIEAQTRDQTRTDVIVDYLGRQYIVELKIWRGERYNAEGERQISEYLNYFGLSTGYMLSFNFNKKKEPGLKPVHIGDKLLYEATV